MAMLKVITAIQIEISYIHRDVRYFYIVYISITLFPCSSEWSLQLFVDTSYKLNAAMIALKVALGMWKPSARSALECYKLSGQHPQEIVQGWESEQAALEYLSRNYTLVKY